MTAPRYQRLRSNRSIEDATRPCSPRSCGVRITLMLSLITAVMLGFAIGTLVSEITLRSYTNAQATFPSPEGSIWVKMEYNRTFSRHPSERSNSAWAALFPEGDGFVQEPNISPEVSTLSVFHQLHCLDSLRIAYYSALDTQYRSSLDNENHEHNDPHHIRHCIDYLRQSLTCMADTNVEPVDMQLGGSTGWGTYKTCRDFGAVGRWSDKHKAVRYD